MTVTFEEVVGDVNFLMGVKAVWGRSTVPLMCFGSRGDAATKDRLHFALARGTAERAIHQPYIVSIGGGREVPDDLSGHVLELVRACGVYGETNAFVPDETTRARLAQWPVAVVATETYRIVGEPHVVHDLGFADRSILSNAFDAAIRRDDDIDRLWSAIKNREVRRRWDVLPPAGFHDEGKVVFRWTNLPTLNSTKPEGDRIWKVSCQAERDQSLRQEARRRNREANGGDLVCEACSFRDNLAALFDVHHRIPLEAGYRQTRPDDLVILCPNCHRWSHWKAEDKLSPLPVEELARRFSS